MLSPHASQQTLHQLPLWGQERWSDCTEGATSLGTVHCSSQRGADRADGVVFFLTNLATKVSTWNDVWGKGNSKLLCLFWILGTKHILNITISSSCGDYCCLVAKSCLTLLRPHGLQPARLLSLSMGLNLHLLHCRQILYHWACWEALLWRSCLYFYKLKFKRLSMPTKSGLVRCPIYNPLS